MSTQRPSRAWWAIPAQPLQELYGAQGNGRSADPEAAQVLMTLVAHMAVNDGYQGLPAFHASISQRDLAERSGLSHKVVRRALERLEKRAHCTLIRGASDGTRKGTNARTIYRIDLLIDAALPGNRLGTAKDTLEGTRAPKKGTSDIHTVLPDHEQTKLHMGGGQIRTTSTDDSIAEDFETFWKAYPKRAGGNPRRSAEKAYRARLKEGVRSTQLLAGVQAYRSYQESQDKIGTAFIKQAVHWLSPTYRGWELDWAVPEEPMSELGHGDADFDGWERPFVAAWEKLQQSPAPEDLVNVLKRSVNKHGSEMVLSAWREYARCTPPGQASGRRFLETFAGAVS